MASLPSAEKRLGESVVIRCLALPHQQCIAAWATEKSADPGLIGDTEEIYNSWRLPKPGGSVT